MVELIVDLTLLMHKPLLKHISRDAPVPPASSVRPVAQQTVCSGLKMSALQG